MGGHGSLELGHWPSLSLSLQGLEGRASHRSPPRAKMRARRPVWNFPIDVTFKSTNPCSHESAGLPSMGPSTSLVRCLSDTWLFSPPSHCVHLTFRGFWEVGEAQRETLGSDCLRRVRAWCHQGLSSPGPSAALPVHHHCAPAKSRPPCSSSNTLP